MKEITAFLLIILGFLSSVKAQNLSADSLLMLGFQMDSENNYTEALEFKKRAMELYLLDGDTTNWIYTSRQYSSTLAKQGRFEEAISNIKDIQKRVSNTSLSEKTSMANALGYYYRNLEQFEKSRDYYLEGLKWAEQTNDTLMYALIHNNISYPYKSMGYYDKALQYQQKALDIFEELNDTYRISSVLNGMHSTMMHIGLHKQAEPYIRRSLALRKELQDPELLDIAYHNMAWNLSMQGKKDSALIYLHKSLKISRELNNPFDITATLSDIGDIYNESGEYDKALDYFNEALELNLLTKRPASIARSYSKIASVAVKNNDLKNAEAYYKKALEWLDKTKIPGDQLTVYLNLANLYIIDEDFSTAEHFLDKAENMFLTKDLTELNIRLHNLRGTLLEKQNKKSESLLQFKQAYKLSRNLSITSRIEPAMELARAYNRISSDSAFTFADKAFSLIESIRTNVAGLTFRAGQFRYYAEFYKEVAGWYIRKKQNAEKAFELIEAAKARVLLDELAEAQQNLFDKLDENTALEKQQLVRQIDRLHNELAHVQSEDEQISLKNELKVLELDYQVFLNEIRLSVPEWKDFDYPETFSANQVKQMLDSKSAILSFAFSENSLIQFIITSEEVKAHVIDSVQSDDTKTMLAEEVRRLRENIITQKPIDEIQPIAKQLYKVLIPKNFLLNRDKISQLLIIPDGSLSFLPFEMLRNNGQYLIEEFNVKYLPSASIHSLIKNPRHTADVDVFAVAGSGFVSSSSLSTPTHSQASYASLPSTLLEAASITESFSSSITLKNNEATEAAIKSSDLLQFRFLHFATHGLIDEENPSRSGLLLSNKAAYESQYEEDGFLNSNEISTLRLNADMVVLSACNTGVGKIISGEGLLGLQRSFLIAGASSVVVSLWNVFDRSTAEMMGEFYKQILAHQEEEYGLWNQTLNWFGMYEPPLFDYKSKALREAKLAMINHPYYNHPVHWAPFIMIGK